MGKQRIRPNYRRRGLRLPDLDHCKLALLNSLGSPASRRVCVHASINSLHDIAMRPHLAFNSRNLAPLYWISGLVWRSSIDPTRIVEAIKSMCDAVGCSRQLPPRNHSSPFSAETHAERPSRIKNGALARAYRAAPRHERDSTGRTSGCDLRLLPPEESLQRIPTALVYGCFT